jgi:hypothetical protein
MEAVTIQELTRIWLTLVFTVCSTAKLIDMVLRFVLGSGR